MKFRIQEVNTGYTIFWRVQTKRWFGWSTIGLGGTWHFRSLELAETAINKQLEIESNKSVKTIKEYKL